MAAESELLSGALKLRYRRTPFAVRLPSCDLVTALVVDVPIVLAALDVEPLGIGGSVAVDDRDRKRVRYTKKAMSLRLWGLWIWIVGLACQWAVLRFQLVLFHLLWSSGHSVVK